MVSTSPEEVSTIPVPAASPWPKSTVVTMSTTPTSWLAVASVVVPVAVVVPSVGRARRPGGNPYPPAYGLVTRVMLVPAAEVAALALPAICAPPIAMAAAEAIPAAPRRKGKGRVLSFMVLTFEVPWLCSVIAYDTPSRW